MKIEYDSHADCAFLWIAKDVAQRNEHPQGVIKAEIWPAALNDTVGVLFGQDDKIIGLEILSASKLIPDELLVESYS